MSRGSNSSIIPTILVAYFLVLGISATELRAEKPASLKVYYPVGDFSLTDSANREFTASKLKGKFWIAHIFFSSCQGPCPVTSAHVAKLVKKFAKESKLHFVSISVDPERDTPQKLAEYAAKFKVDSTRWHFVGGSKKVVSELLNKGLHIAAAQDLQMHSTSLVLVDALGRSRGYYSGTSSKDILRLESDIEFLLEESENAS